MPSSLWTHLRSALMGSVLLLLPAALVAADNPLEARVKAAYLFNLTQFVDWPALPQGDMTLCVVGSASIGASLGELSNRKVKERTLRIVPQPEDPAACHVLFIGSDAEQWQELLQGLGPGILTVSDHADFVRSGGVIGFYTEAGKVRLEISQGATALAGLRISAKVLEIARVLP